MAGGGGGMFTDSTYIPQQDYPFLTYCVVKMYQSSIPCASWRLMLDECHIKMTPTSQVCSKLNSL